jgi:cytochrome c biogenesis protein CcmG, thiol:disulfide interchange protein DsbE
VSELEPRKIVGYAIVAILIGILAVQYLMALPSAAHDDRTAACRALNPMPFNAALGRLPAPAPDFQAEDHTGQVTSLSAYRGKVVFLNFWQTACPPCIEEMPEMEALERTLDRDDFVILALSSDPSWEPVRRFFPRGTSMTVLLDPPPEDEVMGKIARRFGTERWPDTYLIDRQGNVRYYFVNKRRWNSDNAIACVSTLLEE